MRQATTLVAATLLLKTCFTPPLIATSGIGITAYRNNDFATALRELTPDAELGDAKAQYFMGLLYARGYGVAGDSATAAQWFRNAAGQGFAKALFGLGHLYRSGAGVPQDNAKAVAWWRKAADNGNTFAQSSLAYMYLDGIGIEKSLV